MYTDTCLTKQTEAVQQGVVVTAAAVHGAVQGFLL